MAPREGCPSATCTQAGHLAQDAEPPWPEASPRQTRNRALELCSGPLGPTGCFQVPRRRGKGTERLHPSGQVDNGVGGPRAGPAGSGGQRSGSVTRLATLVLLPVCFQPTWAAGRPEVAPRGPFPSQGPTTRGHVSCVPSPDTGAGHGSKRSRRASSSPGCGDPILPPPRHPPRGGG